MSRIKVQLPNGKIGTIPEEKLNRAIQSGAKVLSGEQSAPESPSSPIIDDNSPGITEQFARGAAQGASFGFADEITGAGETGLDVLTGKTGFSLDDIMSKYKENRDESRAAYKAAQEASDGAYFAGELAGGIAIPIPGSGAIKGLSALDKIKRAAKIGSAAGALGSLGSSEEDTAIEMGKDVLAGATAGGLLGSTAEAVIPKIGQKISDIKDWAMTFKHPQALADIFEGAKLGKTAESLTDKTILGKEAKEVATNLAGLSEDVMKKEAQLPKNIAISRAAQEGEGFVDVADKAKYLIDVGDQIRTTDPTNKNVIEQAQNALKDLSGLRKKVDPINNVEYKKTAGEIVADFFDKSVAQDAVESYTFAQNTLNNLKPIVRYFNAKELPETASPELKKAFKGWNLLKGQLLDIPGGDAAIKNIVTGVSEGKAFSSQHVDEARKILDLIREKSVIDLEGSTDRIFSDNPLLTNLLSVIKSDKVQYQDKIVAANQLIEQTSEIARQTGSASPENLLSVLMYKSAGKGTRAIRLPTDEAGNIVTDLYETTSPERTREVINSIKSRIGDLQNKNNTSPNINQETKNYLATAYKQIKELAREGLTEDAKELWQASDQAFRNSLNSIVNLRAPGSTGANTIDELTSLRNSIEAMANLISKADDNASKQNINSFKEGLEGLKANIKFIGSSIDKYAQTQNDPALSTMAKYVMDSNLARLKNVDDKIADIARRKNVANTLTASSTLGQSNVVMKGLGIAGTAASGWAAFGVGKAAGMPKDISKAIITATPDNLKNFASKLAAKGSPFADRVTAAIGTDGRKRQALLFTLSQIPEFREESRDLLGMND